MADGEPVKPDDLDPVASGLWDQITESLPIYGKADTPTLHGACRWYAEWLRWDRQLAEAKGASEAYKIGILAAMSWKSFSMAASRLGLSPSDRSKLRMPPSTDDEDLNLLNCIGP